MPPTNDKMMTGPQIEKNPGMIGSPFRSLRSAVFIASERPKGGRVKTAGN
jgi:hypothetical protein